MKIGRLVTIIGIIIFILGLIFYLQGESVVGPESSFMYANPEWISYGIQIAISGIIISGIGIVIKFINKG
jgi:mannose/fructose/N-acetylgalactosamine-specific phosphotransferase system component IIC